MMADDLRVFIAVETSAAVRQRASELIESLRAARADVKWVDPANLHLTLKFLGDAPAADVAKIAEAVRGAVAPLPPFELEVGGAGAFPTVARPRTIWIGAGEGSEPMVELAKAIDKAMRPLGFPREQRPYSPHLTIGRIRKPGPGLRELSEAVHRADSFAAGRMHVDEVVVFSSQLTPQGSVYTALGRLGLGG
jgi:2'-5' RNA ligase